MRKVLTVLLVLLAFSFFSCGPREGAGGKAPKEAMAGKAIKNPDTFTYVSYGTVDSLDPAKAYDNASWGVIQVMYERLVDYKGSSTSEFIPVLTEAIPTVQNDGITNGGKTYRFKIRRGVKFHSGNPLTPEVVRYSFIRSMVVDPDGGPMWMMYEPLFGTYGSRDGEGNIAVKLADLEKAIQVDGDYVVFNLKTPFAPFVSILAGQQANIVDKDFVAANGGWDGSAATWKQYNQPEEGQESLYEAASGTGPYKLLRWEKGVEVVMERNEDYWGKKPPLKKAIYRVVDEWSTRKLMLLQGDADTALIDPMYYAEMDKEAGLAVYKNLRRLSIDAINFNMKISATDNPAIFSGKLDGQGIPPDFFTDKNVRLGFLHAWDQDTYIKDIVDGAGAYCPTPHPAGVPYQNEDLKLLSFDLKKAEEYLKKAWNGRLWEKGLKVDFLFNTGNEVRQNSLKMLAENVSSLNPKFEINVRSVEWATYVDMQRQRSMPIYYIGWIADYPDPHNFLQPYMHSQGLYGGRCGYNNPEVDRLVETGVIETDPEKRKEIYYRLQDIWLEDAIGVVVRQQVVNRYFKDWTKNYYFNPMEAAFRYYIFDKAY